jgi:hypothetical protein
MLSARQKEKRSTSEVVRRELTRRSLLPTKAVFRSRNVKLAFALCGRYLARVSRRISPKKPANLRSWRVIIMRSRGEYLGSVESPNEKAAEVAAVTEFGLSEDQRHRLVISPNSK